jgi:hypothetical protein
MTKESDLASTALKPARVAAFQNEKAMGRYPIAIGRLPDNP